MVITFPLIIFRQVYIYISTYFTRKVKLMEPPIIEERISLRKLPTREKGIYLDAVDTFLNNIT